MKTKNIFKALAMAMLMPAMLLTTACSNDDDFVTNNKEQTIKKGFELPVTVNVTRQDDATRATYNDGTKKLSFSTGDKLLVNGNDDSDGGAGRFAGILDYDDVSGKFSGTITTENAYTGTADALFTAAYSSNDVYALLLPAGYEEYGFLEIDGTGYEAHEIQNTTYTFATSKAAAVEQFSCECTESYSDGFALAPMNAILNFTITGLAANTDVDVSLTGSYYTITRTVTTDSDGKAVFGAGVDSYSSSIDFRDLYLTVGGNDITLSSTSKILESGKIYNITRGPVVWNSSNWGSARYDKDTPCTIGGVTLTMNGTGIYFYTTGDYAYLQADAEGNYTFTAPTGKKFTKIEIDTREDGDYWPTLGTGWSKTNYGFGKYMFTWTGTASNTVKLFDSDTWFENQAYMYSIRFYVE